MHILIVGIYWPFVHNYLMEHITSLPDFHVHYWNSIFKHTYPAFAIVVNVILSRIAFIQNHYIYCIRIGSVYAVFNYWGTLSRGKPLYPFLTWESIPFTIMVCIALIAMATGFFLAVTKLVNSTKTLITTQTG